MTNKNEQEFEAYIRERFPLYSPADAGADHSWLIPLEKVFMDQQKRIDELEEKESASGEVYLSQIKLLKKVRKERDGLLALITKNRHLLKQLETERAKNKVLVEALEKCDPTFCQADALDVLLRVKQIAREALKKCEEMG